MSHGAQEPRLPYMSDPSTQPSTPGRNRLPGAKALARSATRHRPGWPLPLAVVLLVAASCSPGAATLPSTSVTQAGSAPTATSPDDPAATPEVSAPAGEESPGAPDTAGAEPNTDTQGNAGGEPADAAAEEPSPGPSPPEPAPAVGELGDQEVRRPGVRIEGLDEVAGGLVEPAVAHDKVTFATAVARAGDVVVDEAGTGHEVSFAAVDPGGLRLLVPDVTARETALWQRLAEGDAIVDYHAADRLGIELGERLTVPGSEGTSLRVGGLADTGEPPVGDVIVSAATGDSLGMPEPNSLLAAVEEGTPASRAAITLQEDLGGRAVALVDQEKLSGSGPGTRVVDVPEHVWYRLAQCESSGRWSIDSGNGYYGGLQFLPETWWWVGGSGLPHEASPQEQIRRAEVLLSVQGWDAWPVCSEELNLRETVGTVR